jgi:opacity protein-like surface antigen
MKTLKSIISTFTPALGNLSVPVMFVSAVTGAIAISAGSLFAEESGKWYLGVDAGGICQHGVTIKGVDMNGPFSFGLQFDPGARVDFRGGYRFDQFWAVEVQTGILYNSVETFDWRQGAGRDDGSDLYQIPILANLVFSHHIGGKWFVSVGGGVGGVFSRLDSGIFLYRNTISAYDWLGGTDTDFQFGYQGMAGIDYAITSRWGLGLRYEFLGTSSHEWTIGGRTGNADPTFSHSIMASLTYRFR